MIKKEINTHNYRIAPGGDGPEAFNWKDKPHRLVYDLCREIDRLYTILDEKGLLENEKGLLEAK